MSSTWETKSRALSAPSTAGNSSDASTMMMRITTINSSIVKPRGGVN
jgi:hypothetical protein